MSTLTMTPALMTFCEAATNSLPLHPADTVSNLGPLLAGVYVWHKARSTGRPELAGIGIAGVVLALGSATFHATGTRFGEFLDFGGMVLWVSVLLYHSARRVPRLGRRLAKAVVALLAALTTATALAEPNLGLTSFTVLTLLVAVHEVALLRRLGVGLKECRHLIMVVPVMGLALAAWALDYHAIICDPNNHVLSLHAVWHWLNALPILLMYGHLRQFPGQQRLDCESHFETKNFSEVSMKSITFLFVTFIAFTLTGCGGNSFGGGSQVSPSKGESKNQEDESKEDDEDATDAAAVAEQEEPNGQEITSLDLADAPDGEVIGKCLAAWGKHPFKKQDLIEHRTLEIKAQMLGASELEDLEPTEEPEIVVVKVQSSTLGAARLVLMNPSAWYCLDLGAESLGATDVTLHCKSHIGNQSTTSGTLGRATLKRTCG